MRHAQSQHFRGWQKLFGVIAVVLTILMILNPEFLAMGLFADTAFFDMLVVALTLQMHTFAARACRSCAIAVAKGMRCARLPSSGMIYLLTLSSLAMGTATAVFQKAAHRILS